MIYGRIITVLFFVWNSTFPFKFFSSQTNPFSSFFFFRLLPRFVNLPFLSEKNIRFKFVSTRTTKNIHALEKRNAVLNFLYEKLIMQNQKIIKQKRTRVAYLMSTIRNNAVTNLIETLKPSQWQIAQSIERSFFLLSSIFLCYYLFNFFYDIHLATNVSNTILIFLNSVDNSLILWIFSLRTSE